MDTLPKKIRWLKPTNLTPFLNGGAEAANEAVAKPSPATIFVQAEHAPVETHEQISGDLNTPFEQTTVAGVQIPNWLLEGTNTADASREHTTAEFEQIKLSDNFAVQFEQTAAIDEANQHEQTNAFEQGIAVAVQIEQAHSVDVNRLAGDTGSLNNAAANFVQNSVLLEQGTTAFVQITNQFEQNADGAVQVEPRTTALVQNNGLLEQSTDTLVQIAGEFEQAGFDLNQPVFTPENKFEQPLHLDALTDYPPLRWLVNDELICPGLAWLVGASSVGKSAVALDYALRVARHAPVIYLSGADIDTTLARAKAWRSYHQSEQHQFYLWPSELNLNELEQVAKFINSVTTLEPALIVLDQNATITEAVEAAMLKLRHKLKACILLVSSEQALHGSNNLYQRCDSVFGVAREAGMVQVRFKKQRQSARLNSHSFGWVSTADGAALVEFYGISPIDQVVNETIPTPVDDFAFEVAAVCELVPVSVSPAHKSEKEHEQPKIGLNTTNSTTALPVTTALEQTLTTTPNQQVDSEQPAREEAVETDELSNYTLLSTDSPAQELVKAEEAIKAGADTTRKLATALGCSTGKAYSLRKAVKQLKQRPNSVQTTSAMNIDYTENII